MSLFVIRNYILSRVWSPLAAKIKPLGAMKIPLLDLGAPTVQIIANPSI